MNDQSLNQQTYWDERFRTNWESYQGKEQTSFFSQLALEHFPNWLKQEILENKLSICDAGCAEGQGTKLLHDFFKNSHVVGIDFSQEAINKAKNYYPEVSFSAQDVRQLDQSYDIVFTSNTLEHFENPFEIAEQLMNKTNRYFVMLVPFNELNRIKEHFFTFTTSSFPLRLHSFSLIHFKEIDTSKMQPTYWDGQQILVIYANESYSAIETRYEEKIIHEKNANFRLEKEVKALTSAVARFEKDIEYIKSLRAFKLADRFYNTKDKAFHLKQNTFKFARLVAKEGPKAAFTKAFRRLKANRHFKHLQQIDNPDVLEMYEELLDRYENGEIKGIAIVPSGFLFDELYNQRTINLAKYLAENKLGVLYVPWQWEPQEEVENNLQEVYPNVYQIALYDFLQNQVSFSLFSKMKTKQFYITFPTELFYIHSEFLRSLGFSIVYDVMDEWEEFYKVGQSPWYKREIEEATVLASDAISVVSQPLKQKFAHLRSDIQVIGNGYRTDVSKEKNIALKTGADDGKIHIGYFGHLTDAWFDWKLIFSLLDTHDNLHFHIIGYGEPESVTEKAKTYDNLTLYGKISPSELSEYAKNWHIGCIPFTESKLSEAVDPIKIYEYLYFGLPTIATGIAHLESYPFTEFASSAEEFYEKVTTLHASLLNGTLEYDALNTFLDQTTWESRFDSMVSLVESSTFLQELYSHD